MKRLLRHCHPIYSSGCRDKPHQPRCGLNLTPSRRYHQTTVTTLTVVGRSQLLARWPRTHSRILSVIQRAARTVSGIYLKRTCSRVTSASSALAVLNDYALYKYTHALTHSLTHSLTVSYRNCGAAVDHRAESPHAAGSLPAINVDTGRRRRRLQDASCISFDVQTLDDPRDGEGLRRRSGDGTKSKFTPPRQTRQNCLVCVVSASAV